MFIQVIQGQVSEAADLKMAMEQWMSELAPGSVGWLGSTAGVTDEGLAIILARFTSADAAQRNSDRPEQHEWWTATAKLFSGPVTFHDCTDVISYLRGGSDDAGFVQIIQGQVRDVDRVRTLMAKTESALASFRPDIIGGIVALHGQGGFTEAVYFISEEAAREGERKEPPAELQRIYEEEQAFNKEVSYLDLHDPWLLSP